MTFRRTALSAALLAGVLVSWCAGPAAAQVYSFSDASGDTWYSAGVEAAVPSPTSAQGDLVRTVVKHDRKVVVVRLRFADLARRGSYAQYAVLLEGSRDRKVREVVVEASHRSWSGRVRVFKRNGDLVSSCQVRHRIDYAKNVLAVRLDRACLNRPGSVRANINVHRFDNARGTYSDNAHDELEYSAAWTPWVKRAR